MTATMEHCPRNRAELARLFTGHGVELGVAAGEYSAAILKHGACKRLWSIDRWEDHHGPEEYRKAAAVLVKRGAGRCVPLRMTFEEAAGVFPERSLDFVYVDGYAHGGQEGGRTLEMWWPKLREGGIMAGHDYHPKWPATVQAVDAFCARQAVPLQVTASPGEPGADVYPSWWAVKPKRGVKLDVPPGKVLEGSPVKAGERVLLVGNGPSMLMRGDRGAWIDAFDQVVRFNWYAIRGFEAKVGTKTTLWCTFGRGSRPKDAEERPQRAVHVFGETPKGFAFPIAEAYGVPRAFFDEVQARVRARSKVPVESRKKQLLPSSGLVVALWLLEVHHVPELTVVGIDHFSKRESGGHHYWLQQTFARPPEHDGDAEAEIFAELEAAGRVKRC